MPDPAMLDYFYGDEAEQYTFYRIPKVLFTDPGYRRIGAGRKDFLKTGNRRKSRQYTDSLPDRKRKT